MIERNENLKNNFTAEYLLIEGFWGFKIVSCSSATSWHWIGYLQ